MKKVVPLCCAPCGAEMKHIIFLEPQKDVRSGASVETNFFSVYFNERGTLVLDTDFGQRQSQAEHVNDGENSPNLSELVTASLATSHHVN